MNQLSMGARRKLGLLVAVGLLMIPGGAWGQDLSTLLGQAGEADEVQVQMVAPSPISRAYGTTSSTARVVGATEFDPFFDTATWGYTGASFSKFSNNTMIASVRLPSGAVVSSVELEGCDINPASSLAFVLFRSPSPNGPATFVTPVGSTGGAATPGCGFVSVAPLPAVSPLVIDNENNTYGLLVAALTPTTPVTAVRVYYNLQVSPAPATATFSDVPTSHPFFQFVEALVAAGITSGCGSGQYC